MKFPITAIKGNIVFGNNQAYAVYKFEAAAYHFLSKQYKKLAVSTLEEPITGFYGKGQILLLYENFVMDKVSYLRQCGVTFPNAVKDIHNELDAHAEAVEKRIEEKGAKKLHRYIVFELQTRPQLSSFDFSELCEAAKDLVINNFFARDSISEKLKAQAGEKEEELFLNMKKFGIARANFTDINFIVNRAADRMGIFEPLPERRDAKVNEALLTSLVEGAVVEEKVDHLIVYKSGGKKHYQSYIFVTDIPKQISDVGNNVLRFAELKFAVDTVLHFEIIKPHIASQKIQTNKRLLRAQMGEAEEIGESPEIMEESGMEDSKVLAMKTEAGQALARVSLCFAVAANDLKDLHSRTTQLRQNLIKKRFFAVRPLVGQKKALFSFFPMGTSAAPFIECDPGYIPAIGPGFASELGDPTGFLLGWSDMSPVYWLPARSSNYLNKTNAIIISGSLGGGKSHLAKLLADFVMMSWGYSFIIDPKGNEYYPFLKLYPNLLRVIDLSSRSTTSFNPFMLSKDAKRARTISIDYLTRSLNASNNEARRLAIAEAVGMIMDRDENDRHMETLIEIMKDIAKNYVGKEVREQAVLSVHLLESLRKSDMGSLVYGKDTIDPFSGKERMIVVNIKELPKPQQGVPVEEWTENERQGAAIIFLLAALARELAFGLPREAMKLFEFEETWVLESTSEGKRLLDEITRLGRSLNLIPIFIVQNITDMIKDSDSVISNNVGQIFCFRANDPNEIRKNLKALGADEDAVPPKDFSSLAAGVCLHRDAEGRIGWLSVDPQPPKFHELFDTRPKARAAIEKKEVV